MGLKIEAVQCYRCPMCKSIHKIAPGATRCLTQCLKVKNVNIREEKKRLALDVIRNSVRLEATSLTEAINLLVKNSKVYYKVDLKIDSYPSYFSIQSISHVAPIGKETNWESKPELPVGHLGWSGTWKGKIRGSYKTFMGEQGRPSFSGYLERFDPSFYGFHTGTGTGGDVFDIGGETFLEDFPKIYAKEIVKFKGNHLCCTVNTHARCPFCKTHWCSDHYSLIQNMMSTYSGQCPFDGYRLV